MDLSIGVISVLIFASCSLLVWTLFPDLAERTIRKRLIAEMAVGKQVSPLERVVTLMAPVHRLVPLVWYTGPVAVQLERAALRLHPMQFLVLQEMGALTGAMVYLVTLGSTQIDPLWLMGFIAVGFLVPSFWLRNRIQHRRMAITRDLPEVVDLLNLCVGAGSDFMTAMTRIVREFRPCPVRDELGVVLQEIRVGKRRRDALKSFATRSKTPEASTFARTLIQGDRMGTGLSEALIVLSEDMRLARYHWAERFAQQAPLKMLIPLILSLGAALIIVAGPIMIQFLRGGLGSSMNLQQPQAGAAAQ